jgi:multimeric flavodoxin WrbA
MKVIGFSSGAIGWDSNVDRMVKAIMEKSGYESEFVKLTDLNYSACKSCSWLCAKPQKCMLEDAHTMELTQDRFRRWEDDPDTRAQIEEAARKLKNAL